MSVESDTECCCCCASKQKYHDKPKHQTKKKFKQKTNENSPERNNTERKDLAFQLLDHGLQIRDIPGDGNCLFRALGDQRDGTQSNHRHYRQKIADYMMEKREDFEPFVDEDFEDYINELRTDGVYAGNDAIVAFARKYKCDIIIHQLNAPMWKVKGGKTGRHRSQFHVAYIHGDHYLSVRKLYDMSNEPTNILANEIKLKHKLKQNIRRVEIATGIKDEKYIERQLKNQSVAYTIFNLKQLQIEKEKDNDNNRESPEVMDHLNQEPSQENIEENRQ